VYLQMGLPFARLVYLLTYYSYQGANSKCQKYAELSTTYEFQPVAVKTHGAMDDTTVCFLSELGRKIFECSSGATRLMVISYFSGSV